MATGRIGVVAGALLGSLASSRAWALCPNCLGQRSSLGTTQLLIGAFLLLPFVATYVVWRVVRRATAGAPRPPQ